ncbi:hypothetical protein ALO76_200113 [Pseudomonas syringae pv. coriandricola]|uniref:hypothetical protein n=1 Tax=Pseudomonas syringae group genomosp. 3 TaxID=251701 RepID=UPI0006E728F4|nr:hypothetical protein [Pseudomonas syringae group genomosp. 3]KPW72661.1 hypothetical protein ALO76_200113 [Pseudomonas syringae pv. coriandricola]
MEQMIDYAPLAALVMLGLGYMAAFFYLPKGSREVLRYTGATLVIALSILAVYHIRK